jgi:hypothetical protein
MTAVSVIVPTGGVECEWRERARRWVLDWYRREHPEWDLIEGRSGLPWSKGAAVADGYGHASGDIIVIADADSFIHPQSLTKAVGGIKRDRPHWAVPHGTVYRLSQASTEAIYAGARPHARMELARKAYKGLPGGGIVVLNRSAYETVGGIDPRFEGWGGEDLTFGWVLRCLCGPPWRETAPFWHLYHPHPAPSLSGSPESEALVAQYRAIRRLPNETRALIAARQAQLPPTGRVPTL